MTTEGWRTRPDRAKEIADQALALASRARSAGFDVWEAQERATPSPSPRESPVTDMRLPKGDR
jgi:hypothetical protein